jgi:FtsP/CotA-like multicopper oxidase with cupredoxin domain
MSTNEYEEGAGNQYQFRIHSDSLEAPLHRTRPGPLLLLKQYQDTYITVENNMSISTGIHWHGLEVDSWADGVPEWSSSDGKTSPEIQPGEKFTYKLSLMRNGSFIYHSHINDVSQLAGGLYGPLIVLAENETFDPEKDHVYIISWKKRPPGSIEGLDLNGLANQPTQHIAVGENHRLRLMHIAPIGAITARMTKDNEPIPLKFIAKDGADLPPNQQVYLDESQRFGVGETADFEFTPLVAGTYELNVGYRNPKMRWSQTWEVAAKK